MCKPRPSGPRWSITSRMRMRRSASARSRGSNFRMPAIPHIRASSFQLPASSLELEFQTLFGFLCVSASLRRFSEVRDQKVVVVDQDGLAAIFENQADGHAAVV